MKPMRVLSSLLFLAGVLLFVSPASASGPDIFKAQSCNKCHSVFNAGVEGAKKPIVRDLSAVGLKRDAAWLADYIKKEVGIPSKKDPEKPRLHKPAWKGSDADLKTLSDWLATQKKKAEAPADDGDDE